jgi:hypothetical protein
MLAQDPLLGDKRSCDALDRSLFRACAIWAADFPCADWKTGRFAPVPGETEFILLPQS